MKLENKTVERKIKLAEFCEDCRPFLNDLPEITNLCSRCREKIRAIVAELQEELLK